MTPFPHTGPAVKYPLSLRLLHWLRAVLIIGLIWSGWYMAGLPDDAPESTFALFYPNHKQFGVLVWLVALVHLVVRWRSRAVLPHVPAALAGWERALSHATHRLLILLTLLVPMFGYLMSSSYTQSSGVPFFFIDKLPELIGKNDSAFEIFKELHELSAYTLLALLVLHLAGVLKHRFFDKGRDTDVLPRML